MTARQPVRDTWKGHGRPTRGLYYGKSRVLPSAVVGVPVTVHYSSAGFVRFESTTSAWYERVDQQAKFWFVPDQIPDVAADPGPDGVS